MIGQKDIVDNATDENVKLDFSVSANDTYDKFVENKAHGILCLN